ncbi:MAG: nucleoside recognition domain-containing protein [bacterium]
MERERLWRALREGAQNAVRTILVLAKVMVPATLLVTFLELSGLLPQLAKRFAPAMALLGLPGEAAIALVAGNLSSMYAGVGAMAALELTVKQRLILAAMLMLSHSLPQEGAIVLQAGGRALQVVGVRILTALATGMVLNMFF